MGHARDIRAIMLFKAVLLWFALMLLAVANGTFREFVITPRFGAPVGHVSSTLMLSGLIFLLAWWSIGWMGPRSARDAWTIGLVWLGITIVFEFGFGHFIRHKPWSELLADYAIWNGRIWVLVLVATITAPRLAAGWRGLLP